MPNYTDESMEKLFTAITLLNSKEECAAFLDDLCTIKELQDMAQRLETARLLQLGESYQNIARQVGVSTATISRVARCLNYGSGGYKNVLSKTDGDQK